MKSKTSKETLLKTEEQGRRSLSKKVERKSLCRSTWLNSYRDERAVIGTDLKSLGFTNEEILDMLGGHNGDF